MAQNTVHSCGDQFMPWPTLSLDQMREGFSSLDLYLRMVVTNRNHAPAARGERAVVPYELVSCIGAPDASLDTWQHIHRTPKIQFCILSICQIVRTATGVSLVLPLIWNCTWRRCATTVSLILHKGARTMANLRTASPTSTIHSPNCETGP